MGCWHDIGNAVSWYMNPIGNAIAELTGADIARGQAWHIQEDWNTLKHLLIPDMRRDREAMSNNPTTSRRIVYGTTRVSGQVAYMQTSGGQNEYLHMVLILAGHPVAGFGDVMLDNENLTALSSVATAELFDGTQTAACASLVTASGGLWTVDHKLLGCAYIYLKLLYNESHFTGGVPSVRVVVHGRPVYDPRTGLIGVSSNPALCAYDYMMLPTEYGGMGCDPPPHLRYVNGSVELVSP